MATIYVIPAVFGFKFENGLFFNCEVTEEDRRRLNGGNSYHFIQELVSSKATELGLNMTNCPLVVEMKDGGYTEARQLGVLHKIEQQNNLPIATPSATSTEIEKEYDDTTESVEDKQTSSECSSSSNNTGWTYSKTVLLIELYREHVEDFKSPLLKKKDVWVKIATKMKAKSYIISPDDCNKKWRGLVYRYKCIRDANQQTGQGRKRWEFFMLMDDVLAGDPSVRPSLTISSLEGVTHNIENNEKSPPSTPTTPSKRPASTGPSSSGKKKRQARPPVWLDHILQAQKDQVDRLESIAEEYNSVQRERNIILRDLVNKMN